MDLDLGFRAKGTADVPKLHGVKKTVGRIGHSVSDPGQSGIEIVWVIDYDGKRRCDSIGIRREGWVVSASRAIVAACLKINEV